MIADTYSGKDAGNSDAAEDKDQDDSRTLANRTAGREREIRQVINDLALLAARQRPQ